MFNDCFPNIPPIADRFGYKSPKHPLTLLKKESSSDPDPCEPIEKTAATDVTASEGHDEHEPHPISIVRLSDNSAFVSASPQMKAVQAQVEVVAKSDISILILGESGTGKEVLAKFAHSCSDRKNKMFLKVNCAAMPTDLLESELFGYEQGAFSGAVKSKPGKFEICDGGTIFLDEIGEMPAPLQAKLLHVLQDGTFFRLGGRHMVKTDVRVIAATNINIKEAIANKNFREDLYYRLNGFSFTIPALRERTVEIPALATHFMNKGAAKYNRAPLPISSTLMNLLMHFKWPGNLRELENVINRYLIIGNEQLILDELSKEMVNQPFSAKAVSSPATNDLKMVVKHAKGNVEAAAISQALEETNWNRKAAAAKMQISYKALLYKIKQYELDSHKLPIAL